MTDRIGPTFASELVAKGVSLEGLSWNTVTGELFTADDVQLSAAQAVLQQHNPARVLPALSGDFLWFMSLFLPNEQATIALSTDPQVAVFRLMATGSPVISLTDARVTGGLAYLAYVGLVLASALPFLLAGVLASNRPVSA